MTEHGQADALPPVAALTQRISGTGSAAWAIADAAAEAQHEGDTGVISLCLGDTSFDSPSAVTQTAVAALQGGDTHYTPVPGMAGLRTAIAADQAKSDGGTWQASQAIVFAGAQNALYAALQCVAGPGDEVVVLKPWYATYEACVRATGAEVVGLKLPVDTESLRAAITPATRAILLNSPNNPGGYVLSRDDLDVIARIACERNLWVISDEVYRSAVFDRPWVSITTCPGMAARTIVVNSLSKSHAMTGWRIGWTLSPPRLATHLENLAQCMLFGSPPFVQRAAETALTECDADRDRYAEALRHRRALLAGALADIPGFSFAMPEGGMFLFADVSATGLTGPAFAEALWQSEKLATVPGTAFGADMTGHIRLSFAGDPEHLREGAARIRRFCTQLSLNAVHP